MGIQHSFPPAGIHRDEYGLPDAGGYGAEWLVIE